MRIDCPFNLGNNHDDFEACGVEMYVKMSKRIRGGRFAPEEPPDIVEVSGTCQHVAPYNAGDLNDSPIWGALEDVARLGGES